MPATPQEKHTAAAEREANALAALESAAITYGQASRYLRNEPDRIEEARQILTARAKAWTNAHHQTSRCAKHLREIQPATPA